MVKNGVLREWVFEFSLRFRRPFFRHAKFVKLMREILWGQDLKGSGKNVSVVFMYTIFRGLFLMGCYRMRGLGFSLRFSPNTVHATLLLLIY